MPSLLSDGSIERYSCYVHRLEDMVFKVMLFLYNEFIIFFGILYNKFKVLCNFKYPILSINLSNNLHKISLSIAKLIINN